MQKKHGVENCKYCTVDHRTKHGLYDFLSLEGNPSCSPGEPPGSEFRLARASLPVELRIHCVKLRTLEKCNSSSSVLFLL